MSRKHFFYSEGWLLLCEVFLVFFLYLLLLARVAALFQVTESL